MTLKYCVPFFLVVVASLACSEPVQKAPEGAESARVPEEPEAPEVQPIERDEMVRQTSAFLQGWTERESAFLEAYRRDFQRALKRTGDMETLLTRAYEAQGYSAFIFSDGQTLKPSATVMLDVVANVEAHGLDPQPFEHEALKTILSQIKESQQDYRDAVQPPAEVLPERLWQMLDALHGGPPGSPTAVLDAVTAAEFDNSHVTLLDQARIRLDRLFTAKASLNGLFRDLDLALLGHWFRYSHLMRYAKLIHPFDASKSVSASLKKHSDDLFTLYSSTDFEMLDEAVKALEPALPEYRKMMEGLALYRELAKTHEHITLPRKAQKLKLGSDGELVTLLEKRLIQEAYLEGEPTGQYDERLKEAVTFYQVTHQLKASGDMDRGTRSSLNRTFATRAEQLARGLQRHRESDLHQGEWRFGTVPVQARVNLAAFEATFFREGVAAKTHRVVIGSNQLGTEEQTGLKGYFNRTRLFSRRMVTIVLNPTWRVPQRIKEEELDMKLMDEPDFYEKNNYEVVVHDDGSEHVVQLPGPKNALGLVKFLFPNNWSIYMHDTPKKRLFKRHIRAFSHGCMRVHEALDLAKWILTEIEGVTAKRFDKIMERGKTYGIPLKTKIPISIDYNTVGVHESGRMMFYLDVYKFDRDLLESKTPYSPQVAGSQTQVVLVQ